MNQDPKGGTELQFEYLVIQKIILSMIGMFLILTGLMKNLDTISIFQPIDLLL